ncbi:hypothetical protein AVEN_88678-1 [Araneus ventricosus]|uniref:Histone-lysine N-methyltransferase SETMAR n=1 Tax=Araneus ventricosus TaxID=182803 RepID=A0A4Y2N1W5_ARAVE|nr:hypothetical protein AVEN_88678-1 [Araneus ventricosus]
MAGGIVPPAKCELRSVIRFLQAEGCFVENDQCIYFLSDFTTTAKSHSDFWSCLHSWQRQPSQAVITQELLKQFKLDVSDHPAYRPDLATSDFHLFPELTNWLRGQTFQKYEEIQSNFYAHFTATMFFEEVIGNLVRRYDKCLNLHGDYVKK